MLFFSGKKREDSLEDIHNYIETGNLNSIRKSNYKYDEEVLFYAIKSNNTKIVKYIIRDIKNIKNIGLADETVMKGNLEILKMITQRGCPFDAYTFALAVQYENQPIVEWLYSENCNYDELSMTKAVEAGSITMIKFLEHLPMSYGIEIIETISKYRRNLTVNWFKNNSKLFTPMAYIYAVETCNTELLAWLQSLNCQWNERVLERAYEVGNYATIIWVRENLFDTGSVYSKIESDLKTLNMEELDY
jgi:hypothetical protein